VPSSCWFSTTQLFVSGRSKGLEPDRSYLAWAFVAAARFAVRYNPRIFTVNRLKLTPPTSRRMRLSGKYYTRYFLYEFRTSKHRQAARTFFRITPYGRKRRVKGMCPVPIKIERQRHHADQLFL